MANSFRSDARAVPHWQLFMADFIKAPLKAASPFASSKHIVDRLLGGHEWTNVSTVIGYGLGTGTFTRAIFRLG